MVIGGAGQAQLVFPSHFARVVENLNNQRSVESGGTLE